MTVAEETLKKTNRSTNVNLAPHSRSANLVATCSTHVLGLLCAAQNHFPWHF